MTKVKPNYKKCDSILYGFENVKWYMANIEGAEFTDCFITEDSAFWFKHVHPETGEVLISDSPDYIHAEDKDYSCTLTEWVAEMLQWDILYLPCGDCQSANEAYKLIKQ